MVGEERLYSMWLAIGMHSWKSRDVTVPQGSMSFESSLNLIIMLAINKRQEIVTCGNVWDIMDSVWVEIVTVWSKSCLAVECD
jgi:hypothetical protein